MGYKDSEILNKSINKWFDKWEPTQHKVLLLDDFSPCHTVLGHYIKQWADKYPFEAELKGAVLPPIRPEKIVITSQYAPA